MLLLSNDVYNVYNVYITFKKTKFNNNKMPDIFEDQEKRIETKSNNLMDLINLLREHTPEINSGIAYYLKEWSNEEDHAYKNYLDLNKKLLDTYTKTLIDLYQKNEY